MFRERTNSWTGARGAWNSSLNYFSSLVASEGKATTDSNFAPWHGFEG